MDSALGLMGTVSGQRSAIGGQYPGSVALLWFSGDPQGSASSVRSAELGNLSRVGLDQPLEDRE